MLRARLLVLAFLVLGPVSARATPHSQDLCELPFTELHRAAIEARHIPALKEILGVWLRDGADNTRIGQFSKAWAPDALTRISDLSEWIKVAQVEVAPGDRDSTLPPRPGPALPPSAFDQPDGLIAFQLDDGRQAKSDAAMQALLHWSCAIKDALQFNNLIRFVIDWRGDNPNIRKPPYALTFDDWVQLSRVARTFIGSVPRPDALEMQSVGILPGEMIDFGFNPDWFGNPARAAFRERFQLDIARWILGADAALFLKIHELWFELVSWPKNGRPDPTGAAILRLALDAYAEDRHSRRNGPGPTQRERFELDVQMSRLAIRVLKPELAGCFLSTIDALLAQEPDGSDRPLDSDDRVRFRSIADSFVEVFGSGWKEETLNITLCF